MDYGVYKKSENHGLKAKLGFLPEQIPNMTICNLVN